MVAENKIGLSIVVLLNFLLNFDSIQQATGAFIRNNFQENETIISEVQTRIQNGIVAHARTQPFLVYIVKQKNNSDAFEGCAGSILSNEHILTAGHCVAFDLKAVDEGRVFVWAEPPDNVTQVKGFPVKHPTTGQYIRVKKAQLHKDFGSPTRLDNDIAVYSLSKPLELKRGKVETICIYDGNWENRPVVMGGWGLFDCVNAYEFHNATGNTMVNSDCAAVYKKQNINITPRQICARLLGKKNQYAEQASGDSGGPLFTMQNGYPQQIGVVSFKILQYGEYNCPHPVYPGVYARTSEYISFIRSTGVPNNFVCRQ